MLKKVVCLLLVLACSVALFACGNNDNGAADLGGSTGNGGDKTASEGKETDGKTPDKELIGDKTTLDYAVEQAFFAALGNSRYNLITTKTETSNPMFEEIGPSTSFYEFSIMGDGNYALSYWQETFNRVGEGNIKTERVSHEILYKDGEYFCDGEKVTANPNPNALNYKLEFDPQYLGSYTVSDDGNGGYILNTKVTALELESILGVSLSATSTFDLKVEVSGGSLYMITVDYSNNSDSVHIETSYTYETDLQ